MPEAVIIGGVRTPFVKAGNALSQTPVQELGRLVVRELLDRFDCDPELVDELIAGNVASPADATNVARVVALRAGIPQDRIAHTVNRNCASGFESVTEAIDHVESGRSRCVVAVGMDSMSHIPLFYNKDFADKVLALSTARSLGQRMAALSQFRPGDLKPEIGIKVGLTDPVSGLMMGETAEKLAREFHISREEQDRYALRSHQRAVEAWSNGHLTDETMTLYPEPSSKPIGQDIGPRENQTMESLRKLKPYFDRRWGTVTVGNSCQVTDGAAALLIMDAELAEKLELEPWGRVRSYAYSGCDPARMGLGPVYASALALKSAKMKMDQMELVELNEAFAAQVLACLKCFASPPESCGNGHGREVLSPVNEDILNIHGGAIALGHPVGATGTRLVLTLLESLKRRNQKFGLATLCVGGGQGGAIVIERLDQAA